MVKTNNLQHYILIGFIILIIVILLTHLLHSGISSQTLNGGDVEENFVNSTQYYR